MFYRAGLVLACVGCTAANVVACCIAWDDQRWPNMMMSDFVTHPTAAAIAGVWWNLYIAIHFVIELRLLWRVLAERADRSPAARRAAAVWAASAGCLCFGWASMSLCLVYDIRNFPAIHSVLGGVYGGSWLVTQGARSLFVDGDRERLGLAKAPGAARLRKAAGACELLSAPFIAAGMLLPVDACPDWLSLICVVGEHLIWCHARLVVTGLSYYADAALLDAPTAPRAPASSPRKKVTSSENLVALLHTLKATKSKVKATLEPAKRLRFRTTVLNGF